MADGLERKGVPQRCPECSAGRGGIRGLQSHSLTVWCMGCGWAKNLPEYERRLKR